MSDRFQIWSIEHGQWWMHHRRGYTSNRSEAGIYSLKQATQIVYDANLATGPTKPPKEAMVPLSATDQQETPI